MTSGTDTARATLMVKNIGPGMTKQSLSGVLNNTVRIKKGDATMSVDFSNRSLYPTSSVKEFKDVVAKLDYKMNEITAHSEFEPATQKLSVGATWAPAGVTDGLTACKLMYNNKDNMVNGNAAFALSKTQKASVAFNQNQMLVGKYTISKDDWVLEPSYNFPKASWAVAVDKKMNKNNLRLSYDMSTHGCTAELSHKPFKAILSTNLTSMKPIKANKPNLSIVCEKVYNF